MSEIRPAGGAGAGGDIVGPASATDGVPALFDGTTGKLLKNSTPTGTGNPVLATSPTLVTPTLVNPALGTPASGYLQNCTGYPVAQINAARLAGSDLATIDQTSLLITKTLTIGKSYLWTGVLKNADSVTRGLRAFANNDQTEANYVGGYVVGASGGGGGNLPLLPVAGNCDAGSHFAFQIRILTFTGYTFFLTDVWFGQASDWYLYSFVQRKAAEITELNALCQTPDKMGAGSWMRLEEMS